MRAEISKWGCCSWSGLLPSRAFLSAMKNAKDGTLPSSSFCLALQTCVQHCNPQLLPGETTAICLRLFKFPASKCLIAFWFLSSTKILCLKKLIVLWPKSADTCNGDGCGRKSQRLYFNLEKFFSFLEFYWSETLAIYKSRIFVIIWLILLLWC